MTTLPYTPGKEFIARVAEILTTEKIVKVTARRHKVAANFWEYQNYDFTVSDDRWGNCCYVQKRVR